MKNHTHVLFLKVWKILLTFTLKSFILVHQEKGVLKKVTLQGLVLGLEVLGVLFLFLFNKHLLTGIKRLGMIETTRTGSDYGHSIPPIKEIKDASTMRLGL